MGIAYRPEIDGLRAIAVLAVVACHAGFGPSAGFVGVDVFFVISGYLITSLLLRERETTGRISLIGFYERRVRRILPALSVVILATVVASGYLLAPTGEQQHALQSAVSSLAFAANLFFQFTTGGYFDAGTELMPLLHLWSLAVEEQFYLLWPLLLIVLGRRYVVPAIVALALASFVTAEVLSQEAAFYQMPARFWELAAGGLIAALPAKRVPPIVAPLGVLVTLGACAVPLQDFPGTGALPAVLGATLVIAAVHGGATNAFLRSRPMVFIGLISYSLYLWHWPLLALDRATRIGEAPATVRMGLVAAAFVLAWLSYRFVETPTRRRDGTSPFKVVSAGVVMFAMLAVSTTLATPSLPPAKEVHDLPLARRCHYSVEEAPTDFPRKGCAGQVVVWGDSYALAWRPLAEAIAKQQGMTVTSHTRDSCGPLQGYAIAKARMDRNCVAFNAKVMPAVRSADTLILAGAWLTYLGDERAREGLRATLTGVNPRRLMIIGPTPIIAGDGPRCVRLGESCAIPRDQFDAQAKDARRFLEALASDHGGEYVEAVDYLCTDTECAAVKEGVTLYRDTQHVSAEAVQAFAAGYLGNE